MPGVKLRQGGYSPAVEKQGRAYVKTLKPAGNNAAGEPLAYLHAPDMVIGNDPKAISGKGIKRNNSIIGGNSKRIATEIPAMSDDITAFTYELQILPAK